MYIYIKVLLATTIEMKSKIKGNATIIPIPGFVGL
jgi:hypothetical protein